MNLKAWTNRPVFKPAKPSSSGGVPECRGNLTVSMAAGEGGRGDPRIGEAGRAFLQDRLLLLTDAHVRALMATARVEKLSESQAWRDPKTGTSYTGSDAWVAAFKDKVRQITEQALRAVTTAGPWPSALQLDTPRTSPAEFVRFGRTRPHNRADASVALLRTTKYRVSLRNTVRELLRTHLRTSIRQTVATR